MFWLRGLIPSQYHVLVIVIVVPLPWEANDGNNDREDYKSLEEYERLSLLIVNQNEKKSFSLLIAKITSRVGSRGSSQLRNHV